MRGTAIFLVLLLILSGCSGIDSPTDTQTPSKPWGVSIFVEDIEPRVNGTLHASVGSGGFGTNESLHGVYAVLLDDQQEVVEEIPLGDFMNVSDVKQFNTTLPTLPLYVTVEIDRINVEQPEAGTIQGLYINDDGETEGYHVEEYENYTR